MTIALTNTPILETERLILRAPKPADAQAFVDFYLSDRSKFVGGPMASARQAWCFFGTEIGHWAMRGFGMFAVCKKDSDQALGLVGHWYPQDWPETEVGWILFDAKDEGQGIAHEAAAACINHAWNILGWDQIVSYVDAGNTASANLAKRLGAKLDTTAITPNPDIAVEVYRHPKPEALQ